MIAYQKWEEFSKQLQVALVPIVRGFYANAKEHRDLKAYVRGKWVAYDRNAIN